MNESTFTDRSIEEIKRKKSILCVGLDPQLPRIPRSLLREAVKHYGRTDQAKGIVFLKFNKMIIDAVHEHAVWVKPNSAFYEKFGHHGIEALEKTIDYAMQKGLLVDTDAKRGDGGDTAEAYASGYLGKVEDWPVSLDDEGEWKWLEKEGPLKSDALTIHASIGDSCVNPFVDKVKRYGAGIFIVDKTSFKPNSAVENLVTTSGMKVWEELAVMVRKWGEGTEGAYGYSNVGAVMGATYPADALRMRELLPKSWLLVPGYGEQGGGADEAVLGADENGFGITVNSSRKIIFAKDPGEAARLAKEELNAALIKAGKGKGFL